MFIPLNLGDAREPKPVPVARYDLTILNAEEGLTKEKKKPQFIVSVAIDGHDDAPPINQYIGIPSPDDEPKAMEFKMLLLRRFLTLFGIPFDTKGFDTTELAMSMQGATAKNVEVGLDANETSGRTYNTIKVPFLKDEVAAPKSAPKPPKS